MGNKYYQQFFVAFRIWIFAVLLNTLFGTVFLTVLLGSGLIPLLLLYGTLFGMIVSFPALVLLFIIINRCVAKRLGSTAIFRTILVSAVALAVVAWLLYMQYLKEFDEENIYLLLIAIISGVTAASTQYRSFLRLADYTEPFEEIQL